MRRTVATFYFFPLQSVKDICDKCEWVKCDNILTRFSCKVETSQDTEATKHRYSQCTLIHFLFCPHRDAHWFRADFYLICSQNTARQLICGSAPILSLNLWWHSMAPITSSAHHRSRIDPHSWSRPFPFPFHPSVYHPARHLTEHGLSSNRHQTVPRNHRHHHHHFTAFNILSQSEGRALRALCIAIWGPICQ